MCSLRHGFLNPSKVTLILNGFGVHKVLVHSWNHSETRICADGGYAKLLSLQQEAPGTVRSPTHIIGDMDSFEEAGVPAPDGCTVLKITRQDTTDFMKCVAFIEDELLHKGPVLTGFALGGRIDHEQANFRVILNAKQCTPILIGSSTVVCPLKPGRTEIEVGEEGLASPVGLLPLLGPTLVTTKGFKWNLNNERIGYDASFHWTSSNEFVDGENATIDLDRPALFTAALT